MEWWKDDVKKQLEWKPISKVFMWMCKHFSRHSFNSYSTYFDESNPNDLNSVFFLEAFSSTLFEKREKKLYIILVVLNELDWRWKMFYFLKIVDNISMVFSYFHSKVLFLSFSHIKYNSKFVLAISPHFGSLPVCEKADIVLHMQTQTHSRTFPKISNVPNFKRNHMIISWCVIEKKKKKEAICFLGVASWWTTDSKLKLHVIFIHWLL